jgi:hypothetical protein
MLHTFRVFRVRPGKVILYIGPWAMGLSRPDGGRYGNGSAMHSGWHRWKDDPGC